MADTIEGLRVEMLADLEARYLGGRDAVNARIDAYLAAQAPPETVVQAGGNLQAALDAGGSIRLEGGATYGGNFEIRTPGTILHAHGASLVGNAAPALSVRASDVVVNGGIYGTSSFNAVVRLGLNTSDQATPESVPRRITLAGLSVPSFRGVRGFEINAADVAVESCEALDIYDPAGKDSQGLAILNSLGRVTIRGGRYQAGSMPILIGGDTMKIPGAMPEDIVIEDLEVSRPIAWMTDGVTRKVKNLIEAKTSRRLRISRVRGSGSWRDGQSGFALLFTPASGGLVEDVLVEDCVFSEVANGIQITGRNDGSITPQATRGIRILRTRFTVDKDLGGSGLYGRFLHVQQEAEDFTAEDCVVTGNVGTSIILGARGTVMNPDGTTRTAGPMRRLELRRNWLACPASGSTYGLMLDGGANGSLATQYVTELLDVSGNTFGGAASAMRTNFPANTFLDRPTFDASLPA